MYYRNTGAPIARGEGPGALMIPTNAVFEPTALELKQFVYKLALVGEHPGPNDRVIYPLPEPPPAPPKEWPLAMLPKLYLELHPEGVHAEMARRILAGLPPLAPASEPPVEEPKRPLRGTTFFPGGKKKKGSSDAVTQEPERGADD